MNILVGIPGSGKSTSAEWIVTQGWADEIHSSDRIREELTGRVDDFSQDKEVFYQIRLRCADALILGRRPLVDATNLSAFYRAPFLAMARMYESTPVAWRINTPWELCVLRNKARERTVGDDIMERFRSQFEQTTVEVLAAEGWEVVELDGSTDHDHVTREENHGDARLDHERTERT